ncbi:MAG: FG-GAP repeat protein [Alphaproteobacteria bacterium]|nr:FG-GAP repeat protein [Alphaproteobacteria bacterium]
MILALLPLALAWDGDVRSEPLATLLGSAADEHLRGPALSADLDRDGVPELLIANWQGISGDFGAGEVYLLSAPTQGELDLEEAPTWQGDAEHDYLGTDLAHSAHGLWIGADHSGLTSRDPGAVGLYRDPSALALRTPLAAADLLLTGDDNGDALGRQLEVDDFDGDGVDDLVVSAPIRDVDGQQRRGTVWWVLGEPALSGSQRIDQVADAERSAPDSRGWTGWRLLAPGDLDGDGRGDLVVGVLGEGETFGGRLYVLTEPGGTLQDGWESPYPGSRMGEGLDGRDLDGDGVAEILVGSPWVNRGSGRIWLLSGAPVGLDDIEDEAVAVAMGRAGEGLGMSVAAGPVLLAGAPYADSVAVFDATLTEQGRVSGDGALGSALSWIADQDADGVEEIVMFAPEAELTRARQGLAWLLSGASLVDGTLPPQTGPDADGDGTPAELDCDDGDPLRGRVPEVCRDDVDNDCDWVVDEDDCARPGCATSPVGAGWAASLLALVALSRRRRASGPHALALLATLGLAACADPPLELSVPPGPVSGVVDLSLTGNYDQLVIEADGVVLGGGPGPALSVQWDSDLSGPGLVTVRGQGFQGNGDPVEVEQQVEVDPSAGDETAPVIGFVNPLGGDEVPLGQELIVEVDALDDVGLAAVSLSVNGALLGELPPEGPFEWAWTPEAEGAVTLSATAEDLAGNLSSAGVEVQVVNGGSMECVLSAPRDNADVFGEVAIRAAVSAEGGVALAHFYVDDVQIFEDTSSPWEASWDSADRVGDSVELRVHAESRDGESCEDRVTVTVVEEGSGSDLDVRITQPSDGAGIFGVSVPVRVAAGGGAGIASVTLRADGILVGEDLSSPFEFSFDSTAWPDGPLVLEAIAEEQGTGAEVSDEIEVQVENGG